MNESLNPTIVKFTVKRIAGSDKVFDFDIHDSLINFVKNLGFPKVDLRLVYNGKGCMIYLNDYLNGEDQPVSLKEHFDLYFPDCNLDSSEINLFSVLMLSRFPYRVGARLLKRNEVESIEDSNETPSILICPITQELITTPFKLNGHFYDIDAISEHLANEYKKYRNEIQFIDGRGFRMRCPLRMEISEHIFNAIDMHYRQKPTLEIEKSSMYLLLDGYKRGHQDEYDSLLIEHKKSLADERQQDASRLTK